MLKSSGRGFPILLGVLGLGFLLAGLWLYLQQLQEGRAGSGSSVKTAGAPVDLTRPIPFDATITTATLPNGLKYFVRANRQPEHRASLRLVVNAGSVLEDDDQRGLAHFVEHMAFNGTKRFPKQQIIAFMESVGMRLGPGVNAETGFDDTTYKLEVPTDQPGALDRALTILEDFAHQVTFDPAEIDKERGVVLEEWRLRRDAGARLRDQTLPALIKGSRYADRMPIGTPEAIRSFKHDRLKQFYADWYRPDLMAVIAVGDFDQAAVAKSIATSFASIPARANPRPRPVVEVPKQPGTAVVLASDKEASSTSVSVAHLKTPDDQVTVDDYRRGTLERLMTSMMALRVTEVAQTPKGPLTSATASRSRIVRTREMLSLAAIAHPGASAPGLSALLFERARLMKFGFTLVELDQQKAALLRNLERAIADKDHQSSLDLAAEYGRHFTIGEPVPGLQWEFDTSSNLLPGVTVDDVNRVAAQWFTEDNRVVAVNTPDRPGFTPLTEANVQTVMAAVAGAPLTPWVPRLNASSLLEKEPAPGTIVKTVTRAPVGVTEWTLSNGALVVLLPTRFHEDQIVFSAVSPGGLSLASDEDLVAAQTASQVVNSMGFGRFGSGDLRRWLTGRAVTVQPVIGPFEQGISGGSSRQDLETMFQLIHLMVTSPRKDPVIFDAVKKQLSDGLASQSASPEFAFAQELAGVLSQNHPRARPLSIEAIPQMDADKSVAFYRDRFSDASSFTFVFGGSFDVEQIRPLVERYIASLPSTHRGTSWKDAGIRPPRGVVTRVVERGLEPKSRVVTIFTGPAEPDRLHAITVIALAEVLQGRLRTALREELGGTYSVTVNGTLARVPIGQYTVAIDFTSDPARADRLAERVLTEIAALRTAGPTTQQMKDVRAAMQRDFETNVRQNAFLVGQLAQRYQSGETPESVWQLPDIYKQLTPALIKQAALQYLDANNYVRVTLKPGK